MATRPLDLDPMYQAPRPVESDWYAPRPTQTTNQAVNYSPFSGSAQDYAYGNGGYQGAADRATMAGVPTIGREAARLRPMGESVTTTLPGMAGYTRPQLDELRPLSREEMFFDRAAGATDPLEMQKALKGEASITLQKSDIDRVRAQRAAQNAPPRPMTDLMGAYGAGQRGYGAESAGIGQLSQAQQDFLAGKRQQQKSSPLPTPMEQREIARQREEARMEDQKNWIREYKTMETRAAGEEARKTADVNIQGKKDIEAMKQDAMTSRNNATIGSREGIQANKDIAAMARLEYAAAAKSGDVQLMNESRERIAEAEIAGRLNQAIQEGKVPGTQQYDAIVATAQQQLLDEGIIDSQLQFQQAQQRAQAIIAQSAMKTLDDRTATPQAKAAARTIMVDYMKRFDNAPAESVQPTLPSATPQTQPSQQPTTTKVTINPTQFREIERILNTPELMDQLTDDEERQMREQYQAFMEARGRKPSRSK